MIRLLLCFFLFLSAADSIAADKTYSNDKPLEIMADQLEIIQPQKLAIFSGNVNVKNGDVHVQADIIRVYYTVSKNKMGNDKNEISEAEAQGNVFLKTLNEQAQSDNGTFEATSNIITLFGNVTLLSGKNVVKGEKLVYNISTGKSSLISDNKSQNTETKQRVKGIFMPGG